MAYRPTEKTRARKARQKDSLLESAMILIQEQGFKGVSISQVAKNAGMATGNFYKYFDSKSHLCAEIFSMATKIEVEVLEKILTDDIGSVEKLRLTISTFSKRAIRQRVRSYALLFEPVDPMVEQVRLSFRSQIAKIFEKLIVEGISNGAFPNQVPSVSAAALVGVVPEALLGKYSMEVLDDEQLIDSVTQFCFRAICGVENKL